MGGSPSGGGNPWDIPSAAALFPGGMAGGNMSQPGGNMPGAMAGGNMSNPGLPPGVSVGGPDPYQGAPYMSNPDPYQGGMEPWGYRVPNPNLPKPPPQHVNFKNFPGGRGGKGGRRGNRRERKRNRFFNQMTGGQPSNRFWNGGRRRD